MNLTDLLNVNSDNNVSITKGLLIFYLLIASNFTRNLYSGSTQLLFQNRFAQHIIGYITLLVIMINFGGVTDTQSALIYSLLGYIWFVCTTKLNVEWNVAIILMILGVYLYENNYLNQLNNLEEDEILEDDEIMTVKHNNDKNKTYMLYGLIIITLVGVYFYWDEKQSQFGDNFNLDKFIFDGSQKFVLTK